MTLAEFAKENAILLEYETSQSLVRVRFRNSFIKGGKSPNMLQMCIGEGITENEALHNYTYKIRGKKMVINHDDWQKRKDLEVPLNLKFNGTGL